MININDKNAIYNEICAILEADFECDSDMLKPDTKLFEELDLDSIDAVDLVVKLQKLTNIKVQAEDFKQIRTLQDVTDVIYTLLQDQKA